MNTNSQMRTRKHQDNVLRKVEIKANRKFKENQIQRLR
jgi:hypothetical protein